MQQDYLFCYGGPRPVSYRATDQFGVEMQHRCPGLADHGAIYDVPGLISLLLIPIQGWNIVERTKPY